MNPYSLTGIILVQFALLSYSTGIISEQRNRRVSGFVLTFLSAGVFLDITSTVFMILGSRHGAFTLHGLLGYSSLAGMLIDAVLLWKFSRRFGKEQATSKLLHLYSRYAYIYWIGAYITGALLVMMR